MRKVHVYVYIHVYTCIHYDGMPKKHCRGFASWQPKFRIVEFNQNSPECQFQGEKKIHLLPKILRTSNNYEYKY